MTTLLTILALITADPYTATVVAVHDGDTITVRADKTVKIRLDGIDAPELKQPHGQDSKQALSSLVFGKSVLIKPKSKDRYGRTIARVEADGVDVSIKQATNGFAWWYRQYAKNDMTLANAESVAKSEKRGLWADSIQIAPWDYRKGVR
jgi:endonuclease YncB( thermonuclease family)